MNSGYRVEYYQTGSGDSPVREFLNRLSPREQTKALRIFQYFESYGLQSVVSHVKKLIGTPLWEIRILGRDNIRFLYIIPKKAMILVLHGFAKKTQKTPVAEVNTALRRYHDWLTRSKTALDK